jgi:flagellar protein FliT
MLEFLRICAGYRRRFFLFARTAKLHVDSPANCTMLVHARRLESRSRTTRQGHTRTRKHLPLHDRRGAAITRSQLLDHYEEIAQASQLMLDAARKSDWDEVERQEDRCRALVASLKASRASQALRPQERRRRMELLRRMLADDAEIRGRSEPWLSQLEQLIASPRRTGS